MFGSASAGNVTKDNPARQPVGKCLQAVQGQDCLVLVAGAWDSAVPAQADLPIELHPAVSALSHF
jgi:hypothetical protein